MITLEDQPGRPDKPPHLTLWEKRIIDAFIERYPSSAAAAPDTAARLLRLRPDRIFPGIDRALPDDKESFLEAAESLEGRGLLNLIWTRHRKGEVLSSLACRDPELLYELAGKPSPKTIAEKVRAAARCLALEAGPEEATLFSFLAEKVTPLDAAGGIDVTAAMDLAHLIRFLFNGDKPHRGKPRPGPSPDLDADRGPARQENPLKRKIQSMPDNGSRLPGITTRALSTALYGDSKRLEALTALFNPLLARARRQGIVFPDFSFLDRSYPETFIAGKIALDFGENSAPTGAGSAGKGENAGARETPLVNAGGSILGLPLETILKLRRIRPLTGEATLLTIENKETFFALSEFLPGYSCFLYTGGHPNRAVRALVSLLAESGFRFSHAGDLDPDGILILQELSEIAGKPIRPLRMDAATFDRYLEYGRKLEPSTVKRTALINEETRSIPGMAKLIRRIEERETGVEQEIIDYRE
ncbi:MAG: DUF2220 family protein [Treponema sp.]|jgi:hypothetical protein|nr:DUF2220 family protein [Treponema sp.]